MRSHPMRTFLNQCVPPQAGFPLGTPTDVRLRLRGDSRDGNAREEEQRGPAGAQAGRSTRPGHPASPIDQHQRTDTCPILRLRRGHLAGDFLERSGGRQVLCADPRGSGCPCRPALRALGGVEHPGRFHLAAGRPQDDGTRTEPNGLLQGKTSKGSMGYFGPRPPEGDPPHHYHFQVFALDTTLDVPQGADRDEVLRAMSGHVLAAGELVGTYQQPKPSKQ
jgi:hypothetical protein